MMISKESGKRMDIDPLYVEALREMIIKGKAAISLIQRRCVLPYAKCLEIMEWMKENGYVTSSYCEHHLHDVLITRAEFEEKFGGQVSLTDKLFAIISLGCDKNRVDSEKLMGLLAKHNCSLTDDFTEAHVIIVNTCAFLSTARQEAIDTILDCHECRRFKMEKLVVTGCFPQKFIDELEGKLHEVDVFLGINDYDKIFDALEKSYMWREKVNMVGQGNGEYSKDRIQTTAEHYAYLKIADGCFNHCTYCLIPKIRGKYRSYSIDDLIVEAKELGELHELILVAQDVTRYGEDLYGENKLVALLQGLTALDNIKKIRLLYCYPEAISDQLIAEIKNNPKIHHYLDIPLQHSEDRILKLMNRKGSRQSYLTLFEKLRREIPDICIRSTFIAGFPTETEEEHKNLQAFLTEAKLDNCGFFAYSKEPNTGASRLGGQIHHATKKKRVRALYKVQEEISVQKLLDKVGKTITVVCDGIDYDRECFVGRSYQNAPDIDGNVYFNALCATQGEEYEVIIKKADSYDLYGCTKEYQDEQDE